MKMKIEYAKNYIYIKDGDNEVGYIHYNQTAPNVIDVDTTYVNDQYRGQGIAGKLFDELVGFARKNHYRIIPTCSYIQKKFEKSTEYEDIHYYG